MSDQAELPEDPARAQQWRIFDAAHKAFALLIGELESPEVLAAIATMVALEIASGGDEAKAFAYLNDTATRLIPEVRKRNAAILAERAN